MNTTSPMSVSQQTTVPPGGDTENNGDVLFRTLNQHPVTTFNLIINLVQVVLASVILALNGLVLDTMIRQGQSREPADLLVAGLALTDILTGLFVFYNVSYGIAYFQNVTECLVRFGLGHSLLAASCFHLLCLTLDRAIKIITPYSYNNICAKWTVWVAMAACWLSGLAVGIAPALGWNKRDTPGTTEGPVCTYFGVMRTDYLRFYAFSIIIPIVVMAVVYVKLFLVARQHAAAITAGTLGNSHVPVSTHTWKYAKAVFIIIGVYAVCWVPIGTVVLLVTTEPLDWMSNDRKGDYLLYSMSLVYVNSIVNPAIYAVKLRPVRRRFRAVFPIAPCRKCLSDPSISADDDMTRIRTLHECETRSTLRL